MPRRHLSACSTVLLLIILCALTICTPQPEPLQAAQQSKGEGYLLTTDMVFSRAGRTKLKLDIYQPDPLPKEKMPIVLYIHGGGWKFGSKDEAADMLGELARHGYLGFSADYRLSAEVVWPGQIHDCKAALRWVRLNA